MRFDPWHAHERGPVAPAYLTAEIGVPRFHFNVYDGKAILDVEGTELTDWDAARLEAIRYAGELLKHKPNRIALGESWRMEVTDEFGLILFRLDFMVTEAAVISSHEGR